MKYDLESRTTVFAKNVISLLMKLPKNVINNRMIDQLVGSSGSIGANYKEATEGESKRDFIHKIGICKKETKETKHWIELLAHANRGYSPNFRPLWKEAHELLLIFSQIVHSSRKNKLGT